jgi:DNA-binding SARP family transcriptional activator
MQFRVLGPVEVVGDAGPLDVGTPRQRALLARLLVDANRVVPLDRIIEDLWEGEPPAAATATLQSYVSVLRRVLEPDRAPRTPATVLVTRPPGYLLAVADDDLDAVVFTAAVGRGRSLLDAGRPAEAEAAFDEALALWRGEPYADVELDAFALVERQRLTELYASAQEDRFTALLDQGRHRYALGDLEAFVADHPYRERAWELLVLARYRAGRQVDALRAYQDARQALVEQVGVEPGPRLVELERQVVAQDPSLEWRPATGAAVDRPGATASGGAEPGTDGTEPAAGDVAPGADLVGRDAELGELRRALERLRAGSGGLIVVAGDPGIGKTRLVDAALRTEAAARGLRVGWGRSSDGDGAPSYWPWTQALGDLAAAAGPEVVQEAGPVAGHVVPDFTAQLGPAPPLPDDPAAARFTVRQAVATLLAGLVDQAPTVVVLDDAQWADVASLRLLGSLAPDLVALPLLVVATVRPTEARHNAALVDTLALAARDLEVCRLDLGGLDREAVATYLAGQGLTPTRRLVEVLHARSGGNPFFLGELARLLVSQQASGVELAEDAATRVPHGVSDVVHQRLDRLPEASRELLGLAAVAGRDIDVTVLALAAELDPDVVLDRLEPALLSGMVRDDGGAGVGLAFSHDLVRDALYDELTVVRRARLHRRVADALVERYGSSTAAPATQIAVHYGAALALGTGAATLRWARAAAEQAAARAADDEAAALWELAVRAHEVERPDDGAGRFDLLVERAASLRRAWDLDAARAVLDSALELAVGLDDPVRLAEAASLYGTVNLWTWRPVGVVDERTVTLLEEALDALPAEAHVTRSRAAGALGVELYYGADAERSMGAADEALRQAELSGEPAEVARALNNSFITRWRPGREAEMLALTGRSLDLPGLRPEVEAIALMHRTMVLFHFGRVAEVATLVPRLEDLRPAVRMPDVAAQLDFTTGTWAGLQGRPDEAQELVERGWTARYVDSTMWGGEWVYLLGLLAIGRAGDMGKVADRLVAMAQGEQSDLMRPTAILALLDAGRHDEARALVGEGPRLIDCWTWTFNVVQWSLVAAELDLPLVGELRHRLEPFADRLVVAGSNLAVWGSMRWVLARLAAAAGDDEAAAAHWDAADAANAAAGLGPAPRPGASLFPRYPEAT